MRIWWTIWKMLAALAVLSTLTGAAPPGAAVEVVTVHLSSFRFAPALIRLAHGRRYQFHFINDSGGGHDFVAPRFFAAAQLTPKDRARLAHGEIELTGHDEADIAFEAPAAGTYEFHCSHFLHQTFGMKGRIVVD